MTTQLLFASICTNCLVHSTLTKRSPSLFTWIQKTVSVLVVVVEHRQGPFITMPTRASRAAAAILLADLSSSGSSVTQKLL
jgi:hypothetical protein